ncbi:MAG: lysylphosphatidylglycerol synthase domain-containing protein [Polyangiales bacterium]
MTTTTPSRPWRNALAAVIVLGCMGFVLWGIVRDADAVRFDEIGWSPLVSALLVLVGAYVLRALSFGIIVRTMDASAPLWTAARVFLAAQLGRYIPGKVWQVAGAGYLGSRFGISATASAVGTAYYVVIHNLVGALLGLWVITRALPDSRSSQAGFALLVIGVAAIAFASSPAFPRMIRWLGARLGRNLEFGAIPVWTVFFTIASSLCVWSLFGVAVVDVFAASLPGETAPSWFVGVTHIAAASVAGLAVLVAPSGIGVREAVFVAAFASNYGVGAAGLVALLLRILMSTVELVLSGLSLVHTPK